MPVLDELYRQRAKVLAIAAHHGISNVRLFGSVVRGEETPDSDIDMLIDLAEGRGLDDYLAFAEELESLFHRPVDVIIDRSLSRHFRPYVEAEALPL